MDWEKVKRFFFRLYEKSFDEDIFSSSAQVAFYFLFALFPLLLLIINIFGIMLVNSDDLRHELFIYLQQVIPASAFDLVSKTLEEVVQGTSGGKITFGILATLYSASAGIDSVRIALNAVYKLREERDWWKRKLMSLALTLALGILIFVALGIIFYGSQFVDLIFSKMGLVISSPLLLKSLAVLIVIGVLIVTFDVLYYYVPNHKNLKWKWLTPGAIVAIALWLLFSKSFSIYLQYFDSYAKTYGSVGAIIILLLWLYLTAMVILIGGAINAILDEFSRGQYTKLEPCETGVGQEKNTDKSNAEAAAANPEEIVAKSRKSDSDKKEPVVTLPAHAEKTTTKVITGGIIATLITIFRKKH
jgi:membrane protein